MGYTSSTKVWGTDQLEWNNHHLEDSALVLNDNNSKPIVSMLGGIYRSSLPTYTAGDAAVAHFTSDGKLMVDTELTLSGVTIENVKVFSTDGTAANSKYAKVNSNSIPYALITNTDASASAVPVAGNSVITTTVALPVADANVLAALTGATTGVYAEDTAHVSGDKAVAVLTKRTDTAASSAGTTEDYATLNTDALGKLWVTGTQLEDVAHTDGDKGQFILSKRTDTAASSAGTDGDYASVNTDSLGHVWSREGYAPAYEDNSNGVAGIMIRPLASSSYAPLLFQNLGANATLNVKASAGNVFSIKCHNINAASRYFQIHNTATTPAGAAVPAFTVLVPAGSEVVLGTDFFTQAGLHFTTGIAFAFSTTEATYTAGTAGDQMCHICYI